MARHEIERLWRDVGLPEYFLGNDETNHKLYALYDRIKNDGKPSVVSQLEGVASVNSDAREAERAIKSSLPAHSGDGYGYGGGAVVTIGDVSILVGEGEMAHELATEIAFRWNGAINGDR